MGTRAADGMATARSRPSAGAAWRAILAALAIASATACGGEPRGAAPPAPPPSIADGGARSQPPDARPLAPEPLAISLSSVPTGAEVHVDGTAIGVTPLTNVELTEGRHSIRLSLAQHVDRVLELDVADGEVLDLGAVTLQPWGTLTPAQLEEGVSAWLGDSQIIERRVVSPGVDVEVSFRRDGFADQFQMRRVEPETVVHLRPGDWSAFQARLDVDDVLRIHVDQIARYGGAHGVRDVGFLESAIAVPRVSFRGELLHATLHEQAAAYLYHVVRNHPFVDGNKRTGTAAAFVFLYINSFEVIATNDAVVELTLGVAEGRTDKSEIAVFLRTHAQPIGA